MAIRQGLKLISASSSPTPHHTRAYPAPWWHTAGISRVRSTLVPHRQVPVPGRCPIGSHPSGGNASRTRKSASLSNFATGTKLLALHTNCAQNTTSSAGDRSLHSNLCTNVSIAVLTLHSSTLPHRYGRHDSVPGFRRCSGLEIEYRDDLLRIESGATHLLPE